VVESLDFHSIQMGGRGAFRPAITGHTFEHWNLSKSGYPKKADNAQQGMTEGVQLLRRKKSPLFNLNLPELPYPVKFNPPCRRQPIFDDR